MRNRFAIIFVALLLFGTTAELIGQRNKSQQSGNSFVPPTADKKKPSQMVSPVRKALNMLNFSIEAGLGTFNHNQDIDNLVVVRTNNPEHWIYAFPSFDNTSPGPYLAETNWFNDSRQVLFDQIHDDDYAISSDTLALSFVNNGNYRPVTFKLSLSIKKTDKVHFNTTGERKSLEEDLVRIGGGMSVGQVNYKNSFFTVEDHPEYGEMRINTTKTSQKKFFATAALNVYSYADYTVFVDLEAGAWQFKEEDFNTEVIQFDPFFSIGLTFEKQFSKYFRMYLRPAAEFRNYQFQSDNVIVPNKLNMFSLNLGLLLKYPTYPRNRNSGHNVQMEHVYNGKIYRGRSIFRKQNPRIGQNMKRQKRR